MEGYINENRWIDLSRLPRKVCGKKKVIDWKHSEGCELPFEYDGVKSVIKINRYELHNEASILYITINKYVPQPHKIFGSQLTRCQIHNLVSNRIADMAPELLPYLKNPEDAYLYACQSNKKIWIKCPICGNEDLVTICHFYLEGKQCSVCGDGTSYPEKFMKSVLDQIGVKYIKQANKSIAGFEWTQSYRYDFAFCENNQWFILEVDGGWHRYQIEVDKKKDELAYSNGFQMIRVNCDYGAINRYNFIKENTMNSQLSELFDLNQIDWELCSRQASSTDIQEVCRLWGECNLSTKEIRNITGLSKQTIWRYLTYGKEIGLCSSYDPAISHTRGIQKGDKNTGKHIGKCGPRGPRPSGITKPICLFFDGEIVAMFGSAQEAERKLPMFIGRTYTAKYIPNICSGYRKMANGFDMKHVSKEEYIQYKMINNEVVLRKGDEHKNVDTSSL